MSKEKVLALTGSLLILVAGYIIFWNEGVGLHGVKPLQYAGQQVISVPNAPVNFNNNNLWVYTSGLLTTNDVLQDPLLGISDKLIQLVRKVEMYQWVQSEQTQKKKLADGSEQEVVTYVYKPTWSADLIDSNGFKDAVAHQNPINFPINGLKGRAQNLSLGDFHVSPELIADLHSEIPVDLSSVDLSNIQRGTKLPVQHHGQYVFIGVNPDVPTIGDVRVSVLTISPQMVSVIAQQTDGILHAVAGADGKPIGMLVLGDISLREMIHQESASNPWTPVFIRIVAFMLMIAAVYVLLRTERLHLMISSKLQLNTWTASLVISVGIWALLTIIAWFVVKPVWATLLLIALIVFYLLIYSLKRRGKLG